MAQANQTVGVNVFGLLNGRTVVAKDEELRLVVTWNGSLTFQTWYEDGGWFTETEDAWVAQEVPTLEAAQARATIKLAEILEKEAEDTE